MTPEEIEVIIQSLNVKKSLGPYSIPVFLLKTLNRHIAQPLSIIVNQSFEAGVFPDKLKIGKVNPIHKKTPVTIHPTIDQYLFFLFFQKFLKN